MKITTDHGETTMGMYTMNSEERLTMWKRLYIASDGRAYARPRGEDSTVCLYVHDGGCRYQAGSRERLRAEDLGPELWREVVEAFYGRR